MKSSDKKYRFVVVIGHLEDDPFETHRIFRNTTLWDAERKMKRFLRRTRPEDKELQYCAAYVIGSNSEPTLHSVWD